MVEEIKKVLSKISPRDYQEQIFKTCSEKNCLVVLPTGIGKTLIALMLAIDRLKKFPQSKVLFLAPTRPLAEQHLHYFQKHLPELFAQMDLFTGKVKAEKRRQIWQRAEIVFSTPQCIANDLKQNLYDLSEVSLLIEDECHRCLKNYSYTYVAKKYHEQAKNARILGLTASPGAKKEIVKQICENLEVEEVEVRTRDSKDVKPYLQKLGFQLIPIEFPEEFLEIRNLIKKIFDKKIEELKNRKLLFKPPTKVYLLELQGNIMKSIASGNRNFNMLSGASACAQAIKLQHLLELIETQTLQSTQKYILDLFEQAKQGKSRAVQQLIKQNEFNQAYVKVLELIAKKTEHPKLSKLIEIVKNEFSKNPKTKIIVFSQYRESGIKICKELNSIPGLGINARVFVGQAKKKNEKGESTGLTQKEQQELIREFSSGKVNILCATSIGEEGLDIPEVNAVIFYEPVPSAIRKIQRGGRTARLMPGKIIILMTKKTRDEAYHWASVRKERKMYSALSGIKEELKNNGNAKFTTNEENKKTKEKQRRLS
jgi:Fanconi anemia group M protein